MEYSKHNIFSKIAGSEDYFLVNPLSRQADILHPDEAAQYSRGNTVNRDEFVQKGYLVDPAEEVTSARILARNAPLLCHISARGAEIPGQGRATPGLAGHGGD